MREKEERRACRSAEGVQGDPGGDRAGGPELVGDPDHDRRDGLGDVPVLPGETAVRKIKSGKGEACRRLSGS